jgi:hypothetical protein
VYQYFNIYRQYIFYQDLNYFHEYLIQRFLKSGGTKYNFRQVKVTDIKRINATIFSGFAAKEDGNASIRMELDSNLECK